MSHAIGKRIKLYREIKKMSQQDLSSEAGVSLGLIQQIEQGRHNNPSINVVEKIAAILDVDIMNLIRESMSTRSSLTSGIYRFPTEVISMSTDISMLPSILL